MDKKEFITRQFHRTHSKRFENYILTRIWHGIDSLDVKMVTQQYVKREECKCALLDAYFPQFNIGIEVDEGHHKHLDNIALDELRERDVIKATSCRIFRVDATLDVERIHEKCDEIASFIREKMNEPQFKPWDMGEYDPQTYIKRGYVSAEEGAAFRRITDALKCFGIYYDGYQRATIQHPTLSNVEICFPKLFNFGEWINSIDASEETIYEKNADPDKNEKQLTRWVENEKNVRYVFAFSKDSLGLTLYRFKGEFTLNKEATLRKGMAVWERTSLVLPTTKEILKKSVNYQG